MNKLKPLLKSKLFLFVLAALLVPPAYKAYLFLDYRYTRSLELKIIVPAQRESLYKPVPFY